MNKQEMVDRLVTYSLQTLSEEPAREGLQELYRKGFSGFANMSERRLKLELEFRGLIAFDESEQIDDEDADYEASEDALMALVSRSVRPSADNHFFD